MPEIMEDSLRFSFEPGWETIKFDGTSWHRNYMKSQLKAMDILCSKDNVFWWIEIKDCAGCEQDNQPRLSPSDPTEVIQVREFINKQKIENIVTAKRRKPFIADEIFEKFKDTMVSLTAASRAASGEVNTYSTVYDTSKSLKVVLILTWNGIDFKRLALRLQDKLNRLLSPYNAVGYVTDGNTELPGQCWKMERV